MSSLYFAIVGDTRPANEDDTGSYPTAVITKIYQDIEAMSPKPQFVIATGDYMYANPSGSQADAQIALYAQAAKAFTGGPIFSSMGNHECTGYTSSNCASSPTSNYKAWFNAFVEPLGKTLPYYTVPISATDGSWTAKIVNVACNAWDSTQQSWLQGELSQSTTYTFLVRHETTGADGPCVAAMDSLLSSATYDLLIVGHSHQFSYQSGSRYVVVGNGGAGYGPYGYATVQQKSGSGFVLAEYDYQTAAQVNSYTVP